jgi:hypothetical protein
MFLVVGRISHSVGRSSYLGNCASQYGCRLPGTSCTDPGERFSAPGSSVLLTRAEGRVFSHTPRFQRLTSKHFIRHAQVTVQQIWR